MVRIKFGLMFSSLASYFNLYPLLNLSITNSVMAKELWVHDPGCLHDPSAHAHNDVVESAHAQMTILFCDDLRHCTICSTLAHLSLLSSVNTIEGIIFLI